jgi:hypothetical protein
MTNKFSPATIKFIQSLGTTGKENANLDRMSLQVIPALFSGPLSFYLPSLPPLLPHTLIFVFHVLFVIVDIDGPSVSSLP